MKKILFLAAIFCLLASANQINAQLIIRNSGHAEIGVNPTTNETDTVTTLKLFGDTATNAPGARITFGNIPATGHNVAIGEWGTGDTDQLWLHGKSGIYMTKGTGTSIGDTIAFFDHALSLSFNINGDLNAHGLLIQSDERFKEDIEPIDGVLSTLNGLAPVSYHLKSHRHHGPQVLTGNSQDVKSLNRYYRGLEQGSERYGFLAQNVKEVFPELVHTDLNGYMSVDYIGLIPILVQSINELRAELAEVKGEMQENEAPVMLTSQQTAQSEIEAGMNAAKLYQNAPNPWSSETVIRYSLPQEVKQAVIYIYDMQGAQLKSIPAQGRGESQVTITGHDLKAGMYLYALVADGALIDSKQMILTR